MKKVQGRLIMASHSIGEAQDIPLRSLEALRTADLLIFEEDRGARSALKSAGIHREYLRYSEHDQKQSLEILTESLRAGKTAVYMSDQGCPGLADPGREIVRVAVREKAEIRVVPGPSSLTAAIADTPYRLAALLESCQKVFGENHMATLALDLSGSEESIWNDSLRAIVQGTKEMGKLNFVLILDAGTGRRSLSLGRPPATNRGHATQKPTVRSPGKWRRR
ncbi:MAG: hypothetical protein EBU49_04430 [Proteobacteria bacterium]|nr:hypothetical protein [Pseudomonadota bacterium]